MIVSTAGSVQTGFLSLLVLSTLESVQVGVCLLWFCPLGSLATFRIVSTICSVNPGFCSFLVLSTWESVHLGVFLLGIRPLGSLATWHSAPEDCVHYSISQFWILLTFGALYFRSWPPRCLSTWILYTWKPVHMLFCQLRIVSRIGCIHSGFCSLLVLSTSDYVHTGLL